MQWYYAKDNKQVGPISEADLRRFVQTGEIVPDTLVWREGMPNWTPYSSAGLGGIPHLHRAPRPQLRVAVQALACGKCGAQVPESEMVEVDGARLCAACAETAEPVMMMYAGFWIRFLAKFLDGIILGAACAALGFAFGLFAVFAFRSSSGLSPILLIAGQYIVQFALGIGYSVFFNGHFGATPGKMILRLRIVRPDGLSISYGRAFGRFFAELLSGLVLDIGYIMAGFDSEKRSLHDRLCDTRVIHKA
jgi:uncharacterized RDD family membrane protein YckC